MTDKTPTLLIILDGFGIREDDVDNAILAAKTPVFDKLWKTAPRSLVQASGEFVGLPDGQMGNSEVGHMNLGAGRIVYQDFTRITKSIRDGDFFENPELAQAAQLAADNDKALHILGLLSPGGVHSHEDHLHAMVELGIRKGCKKIYVHAFLDGRDVPPRSAEGPLDRMEKTLREAGVGRVASIVGRYFAMDRDSRWDRVQAAYELIVEGKGEYTAESAVDGLKAAYARDENDEFVKATCICKGDEAPVRVVDGDSLVFMNFRSDRARELTKALIEEEFNGFHRMVEPLFGKFVTLTSYAADIDCDSAFPPEKIVNDLGGYVSDLGLKQLRIAETEKYAHVTFFFSGGREDPYPGETRILVNSPNVATYDLQPEMSAPEVTEKLVDAIKARTFDLVICNFANGDMVGHTGVFDAAVKAVETLDDSLGKVLKAVNEVGGQCLVTADHGNCEKMRDEGTGQAHTAHTTYPVPLIYVGPQDVSLKDGRLCDLAPTLLDMMQVPQPTEMTGQSLLQR
jgi:2,3-bisphosphoglycerate-independent phosphoglycerate mutase